MKTIASLSLICCAALLGACADMGHIVPQSQQMDANALGGVGAEQTGRAVKATNWPQAQWWKVYGDPQLDTLIDQALAGNPNLRIAEARVRQAQAIAGG